MSEKPQFEFSASRQFLSWLQEQQASIALSTYQAGKLFLIGAHSNGEMSLFNRTFNRCMGLHVSHNQLYMSSLYQLWRFDNSLLPGQTFQEYDRCYVPQMAWTTGDLDIHDISVDGQGRPIFVNTLFSCLATISESHSFIPLWQPSFISKLAAEDRCHLNGLAMEQGEAKYVTSISQSDAADGWRDHREHGGCVIDVKSNEIILDGLSMPHSPRLYQGKLWLLDSGSGYFGYVDRDRGIFERVCFCPGYARGLSFIGDFAVVGLSGPRHNKMFSGLELNQNIADKNTKPRCGILIIDLRTGDIVHSIRITGAIKELYDVVMIPGATRPMAIGFRNDEIRRLISVGEA